MAKNDGVGSMSEAKVSHRDRLIGAAPVGRANEKAARTAASSEADASAALRVSAQPLSEYSATNAWNQNYNTSNPGNQNNNNKTNNNRVRAVRRSEAPSCNVTVEELFQAYFDCRVRKRNTANALRFEARLERNLMDLYHRLHAGEYAPGRSLCFVVLHPKPREIWAADFRDRIIHHLLYNRISPRFYRAFSSGSCACIPGRGTLYAVERLERHLRSATRNWSVPQWALKMDVANFFVSIDKGVLDGLLAARIDDAYTLHLARTLLHHDPTRDVHVRSAPELMRRIPSHKGLFNAGGNGLPIGNLTSQFFANVYLDPLDRYVERDLGLRHYVRYVDDLIAIGPSGSELNDAAMQIEQFAQDRLKVRFHPRKTSIQRAELGVDFVGYVVRPHARYLRRRSVAHAMRKIARGASNPRQTLNSYLGLLRHTDGWRQRQRLARHAVQYGITLNSALTKVRSCPSI
jgi:RNA-directed DNA polymerase